MSKRADRDQRPSLEEIRHDSKIAKLLADEEFERDKIEVDAFDDSLEAITRAERAAKQVINLTKSSPKPVVAAPNLSSVVSRNSSSGLGM